MTASGDNNAGLHKRWLERKLEIEVGKVQAKLLSKGLSVPVPDPEALETEARLAQSHLPKLCIELYGRNPNGTLKLSPDPNKRNGPLPPATLVQKLDRILNPALLTPIPAEVALAHGLPLSCCDSGDLTIPPSGALTARERGTAGGGGRGSNSHVKQAGGGGGAQTEPGSSPRVCRSPPPPPHCRPDLQAVDLRIDDAVAEVHRVALQANELSPRERVLYLARQANPHFSLPQPRNVQLATAGASRKEQMLRKSMSRRVTSFSPEPSGEAGGGGRPGRVQASASRRSLAYVEGRRSRDISSTSLPASSTSGGSGGGAPTLGSEGSLPPLAARSRSVSRASSSSRDAALASAEHATAAAAPAAGGLPSTELSEVLEALPRLSPSVSPVPSTPPSGEAEEHGGPLPKLPPVHSCGEAPGAVGRVSLSAVKPEVIGMWGAAAIVHAAEMATARAVALAEAEAEAAAEAEAEAAAAAAEAQAEAAAAAAEAALEAEVEAEARAAAGLLSQTPAVTEGGAARTRTSSQHKPEQPGAAPAGWVKEVHGSGTGSHGELHHGGSHTGSSGWVP